MSRGGLINFSESENPANKPYNNDRICINLSPGHCGHRQLCIPIQHNCSTIANTKYDYFPCQMSLNSLTCFTKPSWWDGYLTEEKKLLL